MAGGALGQADAPALFKRFTETVRGDPDLWKYARQIRDDESAEAAPSLVAYTRANPQNAEGWFLLSMAYGETGRPELALSAARRAYALKPEYREMARVLNAQVTAADSKAAEKTDGGTSGAAQGAAQAEAGALKPPVLGTYQCYFATYTRWTAPDYGDAPIAKLTLRPGNRFTYADSGGTYALGRDSKVTFNGLKASHYSGAQLVADGERTAVQLQFGQYGVQNCVTK